MPFSRIYFTSDVHGSDICFIKFINAAKFYKANMLILGGDITGKLIVSIVKQPDGTYVSDFLGTRLTIRTPEEREDLEKKIRNNGFYPYVTTWDETERMSKDKPYLDELFAKAMVDGIKRWMSIAEERLKGTGVKCYISPGNDDLLAIDDVLNSSSIVVNPEDQVVWVDENHEMITSGFANHTPWNSPRETSEEELEVRFGKMISKVTRMDNCIFNLHVPPHDTTLDLAPELDETLKPKIMSGGGVKMAHVGSTTVRNVIKKNQPLLGLHGHIHESHASANIGRTICINPGSEYGVGVLRGAIVNIDQKKVLSYLLVQG